MLATKILIRCDALSFLETVQQAKAQLVYLDPPWPKNPREFDSFLEQLGDVAIQSRRVLCDTGIVALHWTPIIPNDPRYYLNQIYGEENYISTITWKLNRNNRSTRTIANDFENIYLYAKDSKVATIHKIYYEALGKNLPGFNRVKDGLPYRLLSLTTTTKTPYSYIFRGVRLKAGLHWQVSENEMEKLYLEGKVEEGSAGVPKKIQYQHELPKKEIGNLWDDISSFIKPPESVKYPSQRPVALMERILKLCSSEGDIIIDPFLGSGTTLVAAARLGRGWYGCDSSSDAIDATKFRLSQHSNLNPGKDYLIGNNKYINKCDKYKINKDKKIITNYSDYIHLKNCFDKLSNDICILKKQKKDNLEEKFNQINKLSLIDINESDIGFYLSVVRKWFNLFELLEEESKHFLPTAEMMLQHFPTFHFSDYSPVIIQYCRALENEIYFKVFDGYKTFLDLKGIDYKSYLNVDSYKNKFLSDFLVHGKNLTLGQMQRILSDVYNKKYSILSSSIVADLTQYIELYLGEHVLESQYLEKINVVVKDYRNKSAHPHLLDLQIANRCRELIRECLSDLLINYKDIESRH